MSLEVGAWKSGGATGEVSRARFKTKTTRHCHTERSVEIRKNDDGHHQNKNNKNDTYHILPPSYTYQGEGGTGSNKLGKHKLQQANRCKMN